MDLDPYIAKNWQALNTHHMSCPGMTMFLRVHGLPETSTTVAKEDAERREALNLPQRQIQHLPSNDAPISPLHTTRSGVQNNSSPKESSTEDDDILLPDYGYVQDDEVSALSKESGGANSGRNVPKRVIPKSTIKNVVEHQNQCLSRARPVEHLLTDPDDSRATSRQNINQPRWREMPSNQDDLQTVGVNFSRDDLHMFLLDDSDDEDSFHESDNEIAHETFSCPVPTIPESGAEIGHETAAAQFDSGDTTMRFFKGMGFTRDPRIFKSNINDKESQKEYLTDDNGNFVFKTQKTRHRTIEGTAEEYAGLRLLQILDDIRAPRIAFDRIFDWIDFSRSHGYDFSTNPMRKLKHFRAGMRKKYREYGVLDPAPTMVPVNIFVLDKDCNLKEQEMLVNVWEFREVIVSLLSDVSIWGDINNLNVNPDNPFLPMDDVEQAGDWYINTIMMKNVTGNDGRFVIPLVASTDECPLTANTRFNGQPFLITTTLIKRHLWKHRHVWRCLALIPSEKQDVSQASASIARQRVETKFISSINYHRVIEKAIASVVQCQQRTIPIKPYDINEDYEPSHLEGIFTMVTLGEVQRPMQCLFPFAGLILDGKERTRQTCLLQSKTVASPRISTACICTHDGCGDPFSDCFLLCAADISRMYGEVMNSEEMSHLEKTRKIHTIFPQHCALHPVENAWWKADFGYSHGGIYSNCYVDPMHALRGGTIPRMIEVQVGNYGQNNKARAIVDAGCKRILQDVRNSTRTRFPRSDFDRGITAHTFLACHEWVGILFSLTMLGICGNPTERKAVLCRKLSRQALDRETQELAVEERSLFNQISLLFEAWICYGPFHDLFDNEIQVKEPEASVEEADDVDDAVSSPARKKQKNRRINSSDPFRDQPQTDAIAMDKEVDDLFSEEQQANPKKKQKKKRKQAGGMTNSEKALDNYDDDSSVDEGADLQALETDEEELPTFAYRSHSYDTYNRVRYWSSIRAISYLHLLTSKRSEGDGNKLPKHHDVYCHLLEMIIQSGSGMCYDAGVTENLHKPFVKEPGKTARKMSQTMFNKELAQRISERLFELQCRNLIGIPEEKTANQTKIEKYENVPDHRTVYVNGANPSTYVFPGNADGRISFRVAQPTFQWDRESTSLPNEFVQRAALAKCKQYLIAKKLPFPRRDWEFFTELRSKNGTIFRAHPNYQGSGEWYDWCLIQWSSSFERGNGAIHIRDLFHLKIRGSGFKEVLTHLGDHCKDATIEAPYSQPIVGVTVTYYVPAKILGFVRFVDEEHKPQVKVLLHSCGTYCRTNSLLTREWRLLPGKPEKGGEEAPVIFADLKDIATPIRVVEKNPGFDPDFEKNKSPRLVYEIFDRRNSWGDRFVKIVRSGIFNLFKGKTRIAMKKQISDLETLHIRDRQRELESSASEKDSQDGDSASEDKAQDEESSPAEDSQEDDCASADSGSNETENTETIEGNRLSPRETQSTRKSNWIRQQSKGTDVAASDVDSSSSECEEDEFDSSSSECEKNEFH